MGRYSSYGIATLFAIPLKDLESAIKRHLWGKTLEDFNFESLRTLYPESVYNIERDEECVYITLKEKYDGTDIYSLLKDFAAISPYKKQLVSEELEEIGTKIKGQSIEDVMALADRQEYEGFQKLDLPYYLYWTFVPVGDSGVYTRTMVRGIMIGYSYAKTETEDDLQPYGFLTSLLRYRLKDNPLAPTLLAYLSV